MHEATPSLTAAALRREGIAARALPGENMRAFLRGRRHTRGGECLPCPATLGTFLETVQREEGGPNRHGLFMPTAEGPCRFGQYCTLDRIILDDLGWAPLHIMSWSSTNSYAGLSRSGRRRFWNALVLGDLLFKMRCRVAPYEMVAGETDDCFNTWTARLGQALDEGERLEPLVTEAHEAFVNIPRRQQQRPLVGIVGEVYVRHNRFANQDLVRAIERAGGEAWLAPLTEWVLYIGYLDAHGLGNSIAGITARIAARLRNSFLSRDECHWIDLASPLLEDRHEPSMERVLAEGSRYVPLDFVGETVLTLGRAMVFAQDGASLVVNCAPFGCMPGAITAGVLRQAEAETGVPMASFVYDGEREGVNDRIATYLSNLGEPKGSGG
jgi:predicted nucleotide-binding protein (sugar kinase/HSP70/actin superfamily)